MLSGTRIPALTVVRTKLLGKFHLRMTNTKNTMPPTLTYYGLQIPSPDSSPNALWRSPSRLTLLPAPILPAARRNNGWNTQEPWVVEPFPLIYTCTTTSNRFVDTCTNSGYSSHLLLNAYSHERLHFCNALQIHQELHINPYHQIRSARWQLSAALAWLQS